MKIHIEPNNVSNVMVHSNKVYTRRQYDITEKINKIVLHYKFLKLFHDCLDPYMICIGDKVTIDDTAIVVKNEQDLKNIIKSLQSGNFLTNPCNYK